MHKMKKIQIIPVPGDCCQTVWTLWVYTCSCPKLLTVLGASARTIQEGVWISQILWFVFGYLSLLTSFKGVDLVQAGNVVHIFSVSVATFFCFPISKSNFVCNGKMQYWSLQWRRRGGLTWWVDWLGSTDHQTPPPNFFSEKSCFSSADVLGLQPLFLVEKKTSPLCCIWTVPICEYLWCFNSLGLPTFFGLSTTRTTPTHIS